MKNILKYILLLFPYLGFLCRGVIKTKRCNEVRSVIESVKVIYICFSLPKFDRDGGAKTIYDFISHLSLPVAIILIGRDCEASYSRAYEKFSKILQMSPHSLQQALKEEYSGQIVVISDHLAGLYFMKFFKNYNIFSIFASGDVYHLRLQCRSDENNATEYVTKTLDYFFYFILERRIWNGYKAIFCASGTEKDYISKFNDNVYILPIRLYDVDKIEMNCCASSFASKNKLLFVGSAGHYPNKQGLKWFFEYIWKPFLSDKSVELVIVGSGFSDIFGCFSNVTCLENLSEHELIDQYKLARISIAPLLEGGGVKGKIIDALFHGHDVVTTSVGAQGIEPGLLVVADEPKDFADQILERINVIEDLSYDAKKSFLINNYTPAALKFVTCLVSSSRI